MPRSDESDKIILEWTQLFPTDEGPFFRCDAFRLRNDGSRTHLTYTTGIDKKEIIETIRLRIANPKNTRPKSREEPHEHFAGQQDYINSHARYTRADHYDNYAYSINPIDGRD